MAPWGWLVGYVALFALFHLVLYYVYVKRASEGSPSHPFADGPGHARYSSPEGFPNQHEEEADGSHPGRSNGEQGEPADEVIECPHCGRPNEADPVYTYCWNCVSTLRR